MWRAFFLAMGIYVGILGMQGLAVEKVVLKAREPASGQNSLFDTGQPKPGPQKNLVPPDWAPWSLMAAGAVVILYSFSIPHRVRGN